MHAVKMIKGRKSVLRLREETGQGLLELLIAMTILSIGVGSLLTLLAAGVVSLQRSQRSGTALTLAENQMELYRGVAFPYIRLSATALATSGCTSMIRPGTSSP